MSTHIWKEKNAAWHRRRRQVIIWWDVLHFSTFSWNSRLYIYGYDDMKTFWLLPLYPKPAQFDYTFLFASLQFLFDENYVFERCAASYGTHTRTHAHLHTLTAVKFDRYITFNKIYIFIVIFIHSNISMR